MSRLHLSHHRQGHPLHPTDRRIHRPQVAQVYTAAPVRDLSLTAAQRTSAAPPDLRNCYPADFFKKQTFCTVFFVTYVFCSLRIFVFFVFRPGRKILRDIKQGDFSVLTSAEHSSVIPLCTTDDRRKSSFIGMCQRVPARESFEDCVMLG